jgi:hypothetical protein
MKHCLKCNSLMPDDVLQCIRCGHSSKSVLPATTPAPAPSSIEQRLVSRISDVNWLRLSTAVLTSNIFFLASCTGGMIVFEKLSDKDNYGPAITENNPPSKLATVVATVPDTEKQGQRKSVIVFVSSLEEFKKNNPEYSFLLPEGHGRIENTGAEMTSDYVVTAGAPGRVIVKNNFHHDVPPAGLDVKTRYEATDKSVMVLNTKVGSGLEMFIAGLTLATMLLVTGKIIKWRIGPATEIASSSNQGRESFSSYSQVPWYRKNWFVIVCALIFAPGLLVVLLSGDVYYEKEGQLRIYSIGAKAFLTIWAIFGIVVIAA